MITLQSFHQAILDKMSAKYPVCRTVDAYWPYDRPEAGEGWKVKTPALLLDIESLGMGDDCGDGRLGIDCDIALHCLLSVQTPNVDVEIRAFAAAVMQAVYYNRWGLAADLTTPDNLAAMPSEIVKPKGGFEAWSVIWSQTLYPGEGIWDGEGVIPTEIWLGFAPEIGEGHEPDYRPVDALPEV